MASEANNVTLSTNFNVEPYYDDFDETKNFHRILFRPGLAVQARELTQMQTILQNQIDRFASHIFKEGSIVTGLDIDYNNRVDYVKLRDKTSTGASINVYSFLNKTVKDSTNNLRAQVIKVVPGSESNTPYFNTLYVQYLSGNSSTGISRYANNSILSVVGNTAITANTITTAQGGATGFGSIVIIGSGIVYAKDHFIRVPEQSIIVSSYDSAANTRVGFDVVESIVTEQTDSTLLDPAQGAYNYAAPGAARLKLVADIKKVNLSATVSNTFVELINIKGGVIQNIIRSTQYSAIRDYLATRTYDESGNYVVRGFNTKVKEHLRTSDNQGVYTSGNSSYLVVELDAGKGYVKGYDIENIVTTRTSIDKATDYASVESAKALIDYGNYIEVDNVVGNWDLNYQGTVSLRDTQANAVVSTSGGIGNYSLTSFPGTSIGTARVRGFEYSSGTPGLPSARYKMYLTDITMNSGKSFSAVQSIAYNGGTGYANGKADIVASNGLNANTQDASFDRAVFSLPANYIKRLRDSSGNINNDFSFYKSFDITFNTSGVATINTGDNSETFDGTGVLSDAATRTDFYIVSRASANSSTLTGTISVTSGSNTVSGSGTAFLTQINPGDIIHVSNNADYVVSEVPSNIQLKIHRNATASKTGVSYFKRFKPGQVLDLGGVGRDGTRTITISGTPSTVATIDINETLGASLAATAVVTLNKIDGQEAAKTVVRNRLVQIRTGNTSTLGVGSYAGNTTGPWPLGLSDGFKLVSVRKKSGSNFSSLTEGTDVTTHFTLDTGMRDNYYDHARLVKKSTSSLSIGATDRLLVKLDHFTHSYSTGVGYFSVDSYPVNDATADTDTTKIYTYEIPIFTSPTTGKSYDLRNSIDIRPRVSDTANSVSALSNISINPLTSTSFAQPSGGLHFSPPAQDFTTDLEYYLKRNDVVSITKNGLLNVTRGVPSLNPVTPQFVDDSMALATIELAAYPSLPREEAIRVGRPDLANVIKRIKNERFTMKDISVLRDRIDRLEYLTSLTLLEKNSKDLLIPDEFGNDRFKNGILVDGFTGHNIGNVFDSDYKISIDVAKKEARPPFTTHNIELFYDSASTNVVRTNVTPSGVSRDQVVAISNSAISFTAGETVTSGASTATLRFKVDNKLYIENATGNFAAAATVTGGTSGSSATISSVTRTTPGDLVTLPYTHRTLVEQPYATTTRNCAGTYYKWAGTLILTPDNDYWCDTLLKPDLNINVNSNQDNWENVTNPWQTAWSGWQTTFTGVPANSGTVINDVQIVTKDRSLIGAVEYRTATQFVPQGFETLTEKKGEFVTDTNIQPFMRSRQIKCKLIGMKASTRLYAFFDGTAVSGYITPLTQSEYDSTAQALVPVAAEGGVLTTDANGNAYCLFRIPNDGVLRFKTGSRKLRFVDNSTNSTTVGTFTTSAESEYNAEGLTAGVGEFTTSTRRQITTSTGIVERRTYVFREDPEPPDPPSDPPSRPPEPDSPPPPVVDPPPDLPPPTVPPVTFPEISPPPIVEVVWPPPVIPPPPIILPEPPPSGGKFTSVATNDSDPIAQTFLIASKIVSGVSTSGVYLSKLDLFFATKDDTLPVIVQIQEVESLSGTITPKVVPFGRVVIASSDVNVSDDGSKATPIYFPSPVYLESSKEYAVVVIPAGINPNYRVFTAVLGETDIVTGSKISEQPASGFLFTSANQRKWVPVENEDLKFKAYYASFDLSAYGTLVVKPEKRDYMTVANQTGGNFYRMGEVVHGETLIVGAFSNTKSVNTSGPVTCYAQGMTSNAQGIITSWSSSKIRVKNLGAAKFRGGERVRIRNTNGTTGVIIGNTTTAISTTTPVGRVSFYDPITFANTKLHVSNVSYINSGPAATNNRVFTTDTYIRGQSNGFIARIVSLDRVAIDNMNLFTSMIIPSNTAIIASAKLATSNSTRDSTNIKVNVNADTEFSSPRYILSRSVESNTSLSSATMASTRSAEITYLLDGRNRLASPAIDLARISVIGTNNLISSNAEIATSEDNVAFGGNSKTRYISRTVTLADGQDAEDLRVYLTAYKPATADVYVYYKILHREDSDSFDQARWVLMERDIEQGSISTTRYSSSENKEDFFEMTFKIPDYTDAPRSGANTTNSGVVEYRNSKRARFVGYKYFAIKIVMTNTNSSNPPRVRELRAIALQK